MSAVQTISVNDMKDRIRGGTVTIIDVRTPAEFRAVRASMAENVPLDTLDPEVLTTTYSVSKEKPLYIICKSGARGAKACQKLVDSGCPHVMNVEGGTDAWIAEDMPVVRGRKSVSLERQVRIVAGSIVFAGAVTVIATGNVYFAAIPAFIGAGLVFAGVTDSCAMGMLIAKMPWNR